MPKSYYIHTTIILAIMLGFGFLPPFGPVTAYGMRVLGVFIGCIYGWTIGEMVWPSVIGLVLVGIYGQESTVSTVFGTAYSNNTLLMIIAILLFCYAIEQSGLLAVLAKKMISRKFAQKGPWLLALAFFITASVMSFVIVSPLPVILLLWAMFYDVCRQLDVKPYSKYATLVLVGIVICAYAGSVVVPYNAFTLVATGVFKSAMPDLELNTASYVAIMLLINVVFIPLLTLLDKALCPKVDFKPVVIDASETKITSRQRWVLFFIILLAVLMIFPSVLPASNLIGAFFKKLGSFGVIVLIPTIMMITTYKGQRFTDLVEGMRYGVTWPLIFMSATALALSSAIVSKDTGIGTWLAQLVAPLFAGKELFAILAILVVCTVVITNCINNIVTISLLLPIALTYVTQAGGSPVVIVILLIFCGIQGVVMPAGSVCGALLHGNVDWLKPSMIYKYATLGELVLIAVVVLFGIPLTLALAG